MPCPMQVLACNPHNLAGLYERLITSHHENNECAKAAAGGDAFMQNIHWDTSGRLISARQQLNKSGYIPA